MDQPRKALNWSSRWMLRLRRAKWAISTFPHWDASAWADTEAAPAPPVPISSRPYRPSVSPGASLTRLFNRNARMRTNDGAVVDSRSALRQLHIVEQTLQMGQTLELVPPTTLCSALLQLRMLRAVDSRRSGGLELLQRQIERQIAYADIYRFVTSTSASVKWTPGDSGDPDDAGEFFTGEFVETAPLPLMDLEAVRR